MEHFEIGSTLTIQLLKQIVNHNTPLVLNEKTKQNILKCRGYLDNIVSKGDKIIYGVNTGFGSLCNTIVPNDQLEQLQYNLLMSHACGMGNEVKPEIVKLMLLLKIQSLSYGHSGVQLETVERLNYFYEKNILPVVYEQGSLGASGDLAPLAHLVLPLIGMGDVYYKGNKVSATEALSAEGLSPLKLKAKEGLALINGTQFMAAYGCYMLLSAHHLIDTSNDIASLSLQAFDARIDPFHHLVQDIRSHDGQVHTAQYISNTLSDSLYMKDEKVHVQDPYSFRCIPQVHGATYDAVQYITKVFEKEINSVTDNPLIFPDEDLVISGGNFHGQTLALALDHLTLALHELGNISERRLYLLISGQRGLPAFLSKEAGLNSGFMIPQYTAASMVSLNKQYCTPSSADSIVSSNGQEDHVSMGANAASKCLKVLENVERILAIELMAAAQAIDFKGTEKLASKSKQLYTTFRQHIPFIEKDCVMQPLMEKSTNFVKITH
ncbi:MAG: histidine ammonia-lyase [Bacteroidetes bacterium]|nr:histidine ammonia-lyase [Bacteroidota bacterium]